MLDGWTCISTDFMAVFATFAGANKMPCGAEPTSSTRLLAFATLVDECHLDAAEHTDFLSYAINMFDRSWSNVCSITGDNFNLNKVIYNFQSIYLLGYGS